MQCGRTELLMTVSTESCGCTSKIFKEASQMLTQHHLRTARLAPLRPVARQRNQESHLRKRLCACLLGLQRLLRSNGSKEVCSLHFSHLPRIWGSLQGCSRRNSWARPPHEPRCSNCLGVYSLSCRDDTFKRTKAAQILLLAGIWSFKSVRTSKAIL